MRIGFIGTGNMGSAMVKSIVKSGIAPASNIYMTDINTEKLTQLKNETGANILDSNRELIEKSDIIILAVKPNTIKNVLEECKDCFDNNKIMISIAVGIPIKFYKDIVGNDKKIIRAMPNTPALVGEGMTLISYESNIGEEDIKKVTKILECTGRVEVLEEKLMSEVTALTGSSPAYVFMFIEAMADAAVLSGIPRALAYKLAAQAVLGSAKMVLETEKHPGELKDQVCSPAGTTIEAVAALEKNGFRYAVIEAMNECTKRAREIGRIYG
mgnify:CR=1 FL=1